MFTIVGNAEQTETALVLIFNQVSESGECVEGDQIHSASSRANVSARVREATPYVFYLVLTQED